ncbi:amidohydrolase family protein [Herbiconiux sp. 11R-BC]|uniref:amidohydrolase family protein n=1 Tax=Herbiconiux sp. 11R-BC TaxID=3111637 RepID=UPI003C0B7DB6
MATLWNNALIIAMDERHGARPFRGDLLVDGTDIVSVTDRDARRPAGAPTGTPDDDLTVIDATGLLLTPGLVNAHTHSWEILLRGTSAPLPLEMWTLLSYPPADAPPASDRLVYLRTMVAAIESLRGGATTVLDDVGEVPAVTAESLAQVMRAYDDAGLRATCAASVVDVPLVDRLPFADEVLPAGILAASRAALPPSGEIESAYRALTADARRLAETRPRIRFAPSPSAPQRVNDGLLTRIAADAARNGEIMHTHLLETRMQEVLARGRYHGRTVVEHLADLGVLGVLGASLTAAHGVWLTAGDLHLLAHSGATVVHNPLSNLKLGSGLLGWRALHDAGVRVALGTDGASSNDSLSMLEVLKSAALLHTITEPDYRRWPLVSEVLHAATVAGARAAGWGDRAGSLGPGRAADLLVFDLTATTAFTPLNDAAQQLVFAENGSSLHEVWVDGRRVLQDGRSTLLDERMLLAEFRLEAAAYLEAALPRWRARQAGAEPYLREAYLRAVAVPQNDELL